MDDLPALNEGDETISLADILVARDTCLSEDELWALCRECCLVLEVVNNSPDMFQTLCVTPDTVAFDQAGNVCFLDLDVDPEPIYVPPEYENVGNSYKAHLFSLGMTLLYAAEYNVEPSKSAVTPELRDLLGRMTSDNFNTRPDLESTIILCEEQLCGQSSQEVCCGIAISSGFGFQDDADVDASICLGEASLNDDSYMEQSDNPDQFVVSSSSDLSYAEPGPTSKSVDANLELSNSETLVNKQKYEEKCMQESRDDNLVLDSTNNSNSKGINSKIPKLTTPKKLNHTDSGISNDNQYENEINDQRTTNQVKESNSASEVQKRNRKNSKELIETISVPPEVAPRTSDSKGKEKHSNLSKNGVSVQRSNNSSEEETRSQSLQNGEMSSDSSKERTDEMSSGSSNMSLDKTKKMKRKQGATIAELLDTLDRYFEEEELWALMKEGIASLQRKKKHLPAYISPDTLLMRETGSISFRAIPEEKPLEVIFMAPELQKKGELSEKTCLYGLSVTLRCAAGKKYASIASMSVSQEMKDILQNLSDPSPDKRTDLADIAGICAQREKSVGMKSEVMCQRIFQEALNIMVEQEEKENQEKSAFSKPGKSDSSKPNTATEPAPSDLNLPKLAKPSAFKPTPGSTFQPIKPASIGSDSGAFFPVPKKRHKGKDEVDEPRIPSAFSSPATHFKPIVIQDVSGKDGKDAKSVEEAEATKKTSTPQKQTSPDQPNDKDKEVVRKLKELKKNLMKHRQPNMAKEIENEDSPSSSKSSTPSKKTSSHGQSQSKKSSSSKSSESRDKSKEKSSKSKAKEDKGSGALESLLKEIQKQGHEPDTQSLANAIAQYLQGQLSPHPTQGDLPSKHVEREVSSAQEQTKGGGLSSETEQSTETKSRETVQPQSFIDPNTQLPNLNIPAQFQPQLAGQTFTLPVQYGSGPVPGLTQFTLQQDPRTGFIQMVPVNIMQVGSHGNQELESVGNISEDMSVPVTLLNVPRSPGLPPKYPGHRHGQKDSLEASPKSDSAKSKVPGQGRTARDLVQKTANMRAKNLGKPVPMIPNELLVRGNGSGLHKWKSDHALDKSDSRRFHSDGETKHGSIPYVHTYQNGGKTGIVYDDSMIHLHSRLMNQSFSPHTLPHDHDPAKHKTHSNSSSPSPSKDSGVSGMYLSNRPLPPGTDASLMERLLSNVNLKQQRILGKIIHLLREEFAFDGYMENGVEDIPMAEYISSLGNLKWETFGSAIREKYSDLFWGDNLLVHLFEAVNGVKPAIFDRHHLHTKRTRGQYYLVKGDSDRLSRDDDSSRSSSLSDDRPRPRNLIGANNGLSPLTETYNRPVSAHVLGHVNDTSDSTDNEQIGRKRRLRKKHHLDKAKSSSMHNLVSDPNQTRAVPINIDITENSCNPNVVVSETEVVGQRPVQDECGVPNLANKDAQRNSSEHGMSTKSSNRSLANTSLDSSMNSNRSQTSCRHVGVKLTYADNVEQNQSRTGKTFRTSDGSRKSFRSGQSTLVRTVSLSSQSSSQSEAGNSHVTGEGDSEEVVTKKGHVVYHWAMIQLSMSPEVEAFMQSIDEGNSQKLLSRLASVKQQMMMEKRMRRKSQKFFKKLSDTSNKGEKTAKGDKNTLAQVSKDITEMTRKVHFLDLCKSHLEMLLAELQGIDTSYLYSIATCDPEEPLQLRPRGDNPLLQFHTLREPHTGCEIQALHAGTPEGLIAYLFASTALNDGFIHQFLFCFRYFTTATDVVDFLLDRFMSAKSIGSNEPNIVRLQQRVVDMLRFWLEGFYSIDFQTNPEILHVLEDFIKEEIPEEIEGSQTLIKLLNSCQLGRNIELSSADPTESEITAWQREEPRKWESFKSLVRGRSSASHKKTSSKPIAVRINRQSHSLNMNDNIYPRVIRRSDAFTLADYSPQTLAEQLTLIEQNMFQLTHPVHYLDSKHRGVGVALAIQGLQTPSLTRANSQLIDERESASLFVEAIVDDTNVQKMINHSREVAHWVSAEIVNCSSQKNQIAVLTRILSMAQSCMEIRNFATAMSILDGLENLIIKQLPVWKNLPSKYINTMEELTSCRLTLKKDPMSLIQMSKDCYLYPTIPCVLLFLIHVQQMEIGGFTLANQMFKWGKMRSIAQVIDQIRIFREHVYAFETNLNLQSTLQRRIRELAGHDIHVLAAQNDMNYQKLSSGGGISAAFRKVKGKFQSKSDR